jgi:hypothetical protein
MSETRIVESGKDVSFFDDSPTPTTLNNPQYVACLTSQYLYIQYFPITHYKLKGKVVHGFGRGSKLLGFPTANLDPQAFKDTFKGVDRGVFFGYAKISAPASSSDAAPVDEGVFKAMLSLGTNPHFETTEDTLEAYIDHDYGTDFYGYDMTLIIWYVDLLPLSNVHTGVLPMGNLPLTRNPPIYLTIHILSPLQRLPPSAAQVRLPGGAHRRHPGRRGHWQCCARLTTVPRVNTGRALPVNHIHQLMFDQVVYLLHISPSKFWFKYISHWTDKLNSTHTHAIGSKFR